MLLNLISKITIKSLDCTEFKIFFNGLKNTVNQNSLLKLIKRNKQGNTFVNRGKIR